MAVYLHTGQWSVNPLSQVVRPLTFGEISTTYKSRWYDNDHYNPLPLECSLLIGQHLRPTHGSYDQHMTVTITQRPQLRPTDVFEKWQLRPTLRNQNTPIVAKPSSAISITAVEVEGYLLPCIRKVIVPVAIAASWWYPRLFGLAVFGRRHLGWW